MANHIDVAHGLGCQFIQMGPGRVRCVRCGRYVVTPNPPERVFATCPAAAPTDQPQPPTPADPETIKLRRSRCGDCDNYIGRERCKHIELGCRTAYRAVISAAAGRCPLDKWPPSA